MRITDKHLEIMLLCFACPEVMPNSDCVLQKYRNEIIMGKTDMLEQLSADEANTLTNAHKKCLQKRTKEELQENVHRA